MPFAIKDVLRHKLNERQIREIHEREYSKYVTNLRQQSSSFNVSYLPMEHIREIERSRVRNVLQRQIQYKRINEENNVLSERLFKINKQTNIDDKNGKYQQNLETFNSKRFQQRANQYKRIENENQLFIKRIHNVRGQLISKQQCDQDWQRHIKVMKKNCDYPENIDRFVSNVNPNQRPHSCKWNKNRYDINQRSSQVTERPLTVLLGLVE